MSLRPGISTRTRRTLPGAWPGLAACALATLLIVVAAAGQDSAQPAPIEYDLADTEILADAAPDNAGRIDSARAPGISDRIAAARGQLQKFSATGNARYLRYARSTLDSADVQQGTNAELLVLKGRLLQAEHRFDAAAGALQRALALQPDYPEAWLLLTDSLRRAGRIDEARTGCIKLALSGEAQLAQWCAIQILQSKGEDQRAYALARDELAATSEREGNVYRWALEITADAAARAGDLQQAVTLYRLALTTGSDGFAARLALADVMLRSGYGEAVIELLDKHNENLSAQIRVAIAHKVSGRKLDNAILNRITSSFAELSPSNVDDPRLRDRAIFELRYNDNPALALEYAIANWHQQKGREDLDLLNDAAQQAGDESALAIVERWYRQSHPGIRT